MKAEIIVNFKGDEDFKEYIDDSLNYIIPNVYKFKKLFSTTTLPLEIIMNKKFHQYTNFKDLIILININQTNRIGNILLVSIDFMINNFQLPNYLVDHIFYELNEDFADGVYFDRRKVNENIFTLQFI